MGFVEGSTAGVVVEAVAVGRQVGSVEDGAEVGLVDGVSDDMDQVEISCHKHDLLEHSSDRGAAGQDNAGRLLVWKAEVDIDVAVAPVEAWIA
jgi:hypothetical protein